MVLKTFVAGEVLTAADVNLYLKNMLTAIKPANESVTSSTVLQDDDHLSIPLAANSTYLVIGVLNYDGALTGDFKMAFTGPAGVTLNIHTDGLGIAATDGTGDQVFLIEAVAPAGGAFGTIAAADHRPLLFIGFVATGGTAGNLQLQWAQNTSNGTATRVLATSGMIGIRAS
jgi:hypothetical protein